MNRCLCVFYSCFQAVDWWSVGVLTYELLTGASPFTVEGERNTQQEISKRILKSNPPIPESLGKDVADFISKLLVKDPRERLGGGEEDAKELKRHAFFKNLDWDALALKSIPAPFKPNIRNELDVSNFSEEFTKMPPTDSPAVVPPNYDKIFKGYSYVAPSILFSRNVISEDIMRPVRHHTSDEILAHCQLSDSLFFQQYDIDFNELILGDGSFSVVRRCIKKSTNKEYAVKIVSRRIDCTQEINLLRACQGHQNIVTLYEVFQDIAHTYLVFELLKGGELLGRIRRKSKFTEAEASAILRKLVSAVSFMHSRGVVHRDLKPENLLFTSDDDNADIKVVDFGFARLKQEKEQLHTPCFTLHYAAPEVLNGDPEGYDENCDLWSLGVILYTMLCGRAPFHARSRDDSAAAVMNRIKGGDFSFSSPAWLEVSHAAKMVTKGLLTVNPNKRLTMNNLKINNWVQGNQNMPQTPLMTPDVLSSSSSAEQSLQTTFNAFHKAHREGFRLQDVLNAKLAQRRRLKKSSSENRSTSTSSTFSSESSIKSAPSTPLTSRIDFTKSDSKKSLSDSTSSIKVSSDSSSSSRKENVFNFGEARVTEYLRTMSSSPIEPENFSPDVQSTSEKLEDDTNFEPQNETKLDELLQVQERKPTRKKRETKLLLPVRQSARIQERKSNQSQISSDRLTAQKETYVTVPVRRRQRKEETYEKVIDSNDEVPLVSQRNGKITLKMEIKKGRQKRKVYSTECKCQTRNKPNSEAPKAKIRKRVEDEDARGRKRTQRLNVSR